MVVFLSQFKWENRHRLRGWATLTLGLTPCSRISALLSMKLTATGLSVVVLFG